MPLLTYKAVAALTSLPVGTLYAMVHDGTIPFVRLGARTVRFDQETLMAWMASRRGGPTVDGSAPSHPPGSGPSTACDCAACPPCRKDRCPQQPRGGRQ